MDWVDQSVTGGAAAREFNTTHWSVVLAAAETHSPAASAALERLCRDYWYPLYAHVRRQGRSHEDAQDLTQQFFVRLLERRDLGKAEQNRGRFRTFLLSALNNFLINEWEKATADKRGGGRPCSSLEEQQAEKRFALEPADADAPDTLFDKRWAAALLERSLAKLREEFAAAGRGRLFDSLKELVWGEKTGVSRAELGKQLGLSEGAVNVAAHRMRERYRELLRAEVAHTVATPAEIDAELRYLISVLRG
jgi:RNA polymerase sigma factor (sigma-70 family)